MKKRKLKFSPILTQAVNEGLDIISPSVTSVVLFYLKKDQAISSNNCIFNPEVFEQGLEKIFGYGAKVIEKKILEVLYLKLEVSKKVENDFNFSEKLKEAQQLFESVEVLTTETH